MSDFVDRHIKDRIGDFAGRRRYLDGGDIAWIMARKREGLSDQHIAVMGNIALPDVQKVCSEHQAPAPIYQRSTYEPCHQRASLSFGLRVCEAPGNLLVFRSAFSSRLVLSEGLARATVAKVRFKRTWKAIVCEVAAKHGLTFDDLIGPSRRKAIAHPRQEAMYLLVMERRWSLPQIGGFLGKRDHTTVLHGARAHARRNGLPMPCGSQLAEAA